jgi:ABC-type bacteriocin/lantibiotic exporter with double-glycine peptidase domain
MVLLGFNMDVAEADLRRLCDCNFSGTSALKAVNAARQLGFARTAKHMLSVDDLEAVVTDGKFPIVFVDLTPIDGLCEAHAFVVIGVSGSDIQVYDPAKGERFIPRRVFALAWARRHQLAIIVER